MPRITRVNSFAIGSVPSGASSEDSFQALLEKTSALAVKWSPEQTDAHFAIKAKQER